MGGTSVQSGVSDMILKKWSSAVLTVLPLVMVCILVTMTCPDEASATIQKRGICINGKCGKAASLFATPDVTPEGKTRLPNNLPPVKSYDGSKTCQLPPKKILPPDKDIKYQFRFLTTIITTKGKTPSKVCAGIYITPNWVLTSTNCLYRRSLGASIDWSAVLSLSVYYIRKFYAKSGYNPVNHSNDIALFKVPFWANYRACAPTFSETPVYHTECIATTWDLHSRYGVKYEGYGSYNLRYANVTLTSDVRYGLYIFVKVFTYPLGVDVREFNGPLLCPINRRLTVVGIRSYHPTDTIAAHVTYTRIGYYRHWISNIVLK